MVRKRKHGRCLHGAYGLGEVRVIKDSHVASLRNRCSITARAGAGEEKDVVLW